jgi:hypothetical protein
MVTQGCCCWYFEKAAAKNGASNVDPAPDRVGLWPAGPMLATADAGVLVVARAGAGAEGEDDDRRGGGPDGGAGWIAA